MNRRHFLKTATAIGWIALDPHIAFCAGPATPYDRLLILIELKGGNDGLNTLVPYADRDYYALRPRLAIPREQVLPLDERCGLHSSMSALLPLWHAQELAVIQGVGYPKPNLSHFRSIDIWDTASDADEYLQQGWLARAFARTPAPADFVADGLILGSQETGPLSGSGVRALALDRPQRFLRQAKLASDSGHARNAALEHILRVERDVVRSASRLSLDRDLKTTFAQSAFGNALKTAAQVIGGEGRVAAVKISLSGFDTHSNQLATQARLLQELSEGLSALRSALQEVSKWNGTLVMTYAEFGRRPKENQSGGTDHGTGNVHFALGGKVRGGLYGAPPRFGALDANGNLPFAIDFRVLSATVLARWWGVPSDKILLRHFTAIDLLKV
jgi:uncharacterized protein (DUF1501 family)